MKIKYSQILELYHAYNGLSEEKLPLKESVAIARNKKELKPIVETIVEKKNDIVKEYMSEEINSIPKEKQQECNNRIVEELNVEEELDSLKQIYLPENIQVSTNVIEILSELNLIKNEI